MTLDRPVFLRYLLSYLIILLLPLLLVVVFVFARFISVLEQQAISSAAASAEQIETVLDIAIRDIYRLPMELALNSSLTPLSQEIDDYERYMTVRELRKHASSRELIRLLGLYRKGEPVLYSDAGVYDLKYFNNRVFQYERWSQGDFLNDIKAVRNPQVRPAETVTIATDSDMPTRLITFLFSVPPNTLNAYATALVVVSDDAVKRLMGRSAKQKLNTIVFDPAGTVVTSTFEIDDLQAAQIRRLPERMAGRRQGVFDVGPERFVVAYRQSEATGWGYLTLLPIEPVLGHVAIIQLQTVGILLLILAIGSAGVLLAMRLNYRPLQHLTAFVNALAGDTDRALETESAEIEYIQAAFRGLVGDLNTLAAGLAGNRTAARELLLTALIAGRVATVDEFNRRGHELGMTLTGRLFAVIVFAPEDGRIETEGIVSAIERNVPRRVDGYAKLVTDAGLIVFIVSGDDLSGPTLSEIARIGLVGLEANTRSTWLVGVGSPFDQVSGLGRSYVEACAAIEHRPNSTEGKVCVFSDSVPLHLNLDRFPWQELGEIRRHALSGDIRMISLTIEAFSERIEGAGMPLFLMRHFSFEVVGILMRALSEREIPISIVDWPALDSTRLMRCHSFGELHKALLEACEAMRPYFERNEVDSGGPDEIRARVQAYIQENFTRYDFTLDSVAREFGMSSSSLSRHFKQSSGISFSDAVHAVRLKEAELLLVRTDMSIEEIAAHVGFAGSSSFIRMFRRRTGVTPGTFRVRAGDRTPQPSEPHATSGGLH